MTHPGNTWTIVCAAALTGWGVGGALYVRYRLRPLRAATARGTHQFELARSSRSLWEKRILLRKALDTTRAHRHITGQLARWEKWVHTPVMVVLTALTLGMAVWGVF